MIDLLELTPAAPAPSAQLIQIIFLKLVKPVILVLKAWGNAPRPAPAHPGNLLPR
jgi:hypothetical protein